jgi:hypothetical protein
MKSRRNAARSRFSSSACTDERPTVKPYHVFLFVWLIATGPTYLVVSSETRSSQDNIHTAKLVSGKVTKAKYSMRSQNYWLEVSIPSTFGITQCSGSISSDEYAATRSRGGLVDMYVSPDRNAPLRCWSASELHKSASRSTADQFGLSVLLGLCAGLFLYLMVVRIPFGTQRKSLKRRWSE